MLDCSSAMSRAESLHFRFDKSIRTTSTFVGPIQRTVNADAGDLIPIGYVFCCGNYGAGGVACGSESRTSRDAST